jgi:hypothetical protein
MALSSVYLRRSVTYGRSARVRALLCHLPLELQRSTCDAARENLSLLVEELLEELRVLVVDILDSCLLETAVLLLPYLECRRVKETDAVILILDILCHNSILLV